MQLTHAIPAALFTAGDTKPWSLLRDDEIEAYMEAVVENEELGMVVARCQETYAAPPTRRADDSCEARGMPLDKHGGQARTPSYPRR